MAITIRRYLPESSIPRGPGFQPFGYKDLDVFYHELGEFIFKDLWDKQEIEFEYALKKADKEQFESDFAQEMWMTWCARVEETLSNFVLTDYRQLPNTKSDLWKSTKENLLKEIDQSIDLILNSTENPAVYERRKSDYEFIRKVFENKIEEGLRHFFIFSHMKRIFYNKELVVYIIPQKTGNPIEIAYNDWFAKDKLKVQLIHKAASYGDLYGRIVVKDKDAKEFISGIKFGVKTQDVQTESDLCTKLFDINLLTEAPELYYTMQMLAEVIKKYKTWNEGSREDHKKYIEEIFNEKINNYPTLEKFLNSTLRERIVDLVSSAKAKRERVGRPPGT